MTVLLSLLTAVIFGTGDFFGGLAAKRAKILQVIAGSHLVGLVGVTIAALALAEEFRTDDFLLGAAGGAFGGVGVGLLYRRLAIGPMSVVAPLTALTSVAVPTVWGAFTGDELGVLAWAGVAFAVLAIVMVSSSSDGSHAAISPQVIVESLLAGIGFGGFFIFLDATDSVAAPWPVVGARLLTASFLLVFMVGTRRQLLPRADGALVLIAVTGLLDTASNVVFLYATNRGVLTLVAVLSSLYPVATVVLARLILDEKMTRIQLAGFVAAMLGTVFIAAA